MTFSTVYVDTSVLLRWLLGQTGAISGWGQWGAAIASELLWIEGRRTLDRLRAGGKMSDLDVAVAADLLRRATAQFEEVRLQRAILERAASRFPTELGTLDAIHLATALSWVGEKDQSLTFLTHDRRLAIAAQASGLDVGPEPILSFRER